MQISKSSNFREDWKKGILFLSKYMRNTAMLQIFIKEHLKEHTRFFHIISLSQARVTLHSFMPFHTRTFINNTHQLCSLKSYLFVPQETTVSVHKNMCFYWQKQVESSSTSILSLHDDSWASFPSKPVELPCLLLHNYASTTTDAGWCRLHCCLCRSLFPLPFFLLSSLPAQPELSYVTALSWGLSLYSLCISLFLSEGETCDVPFYTSHTILEGCAIFC